MLFCWVNPGALGETDRNSRSGKRLESGLGTFEVGSPTAGYTRHEGLGNLPSPDLNIYEWRAASTLQPPYNRVRRVYDDLQGPPQTESSFVQEVIEYEKISIDELLDMKTEELDNFVALYRLQPFLSNLPGPKGWFTNDQGARDVRNEITNALHDQLKDITVDGESKPYWRREVSYIVIRDSNGQRLLYPLNETEWGQLVKAAALHTDKMQDSIVDILNRYDALHGAGDFDGLAAIDPTDPGRWEQVYEGPVSTSIKVVTAAQAAAIRSGG